MSRPLVIIESPYRGDVEANKTYARACLLDSLKRGEAPIASHLLHTQVLDDTIAEERTMGIAAGVAWLAVADCVAVYYDRGISLGMAKAIEAAGKADITVEYRSLREVPTNV